MQAPAVSACATRGRERVSVDGGDSSGSRVLDMALRSLYLLVVLRAVVEAMRAQHIFLDSLIVRRHGCCLAVLQLGTQKVR